MEKKYLLGLDNGGTTVKAGLYDTNGNEIYTAKTFVTQIMPHDGWLERSAEQVWKANCQAVNDVLEGSGINSADILGVSITGYGNGAFFVGEDLNPSYENCILSGDVRAKEYIKNYLSTGVQDKIIGRTNQILWAGQTTPIMAWMRDNMPQVMQKTRHILMCKDFLRLRLTGEVAGEISDMSGISAMNQETRMVDPEILSEMGLEQYAHMLPQRILGSYEIGGHITAKAAEQTGLAQGTPVMGGLFDITSCAIATGVTDSSRLCMILGTWSINEYISKKPISSSDLFMTSLYCIDGYYMHTEGSTTSASNLQWFIDHFMGEEKTAMELVGKNVFDACEDMIASVPYDDSTILFLPFLYGTNVNLDAKAGFIGISGRHTKAHMLRAVYEGIVFSHMYHVEKLQKFRSEPYEAIRISGGGAGSAEWVQMFCDALQLPIEIPAAKELGTMGVAMCCAVGAGLFDNLEQAAEVFAKVKKTYTPNPARAEYYRKKYELYKGVITALDGTWEQFNQVEK